MIGVAVLLLCASALAFEMRRRDNETSGLRCILFGFPVRLEDDGGVTPLGPITGMLIDFACTTFGFNGQVYEYEIGHYWPALWDWLKGDDDDGCGDGGAA